MPTSKLLILFVILVRDQEVGGSNPLAPTKFLKDLQTLPPEIRVQKGSVFGPYSDPDFCTALALVPVF